MVKSIVALTLFAAASIAVPVPQPGNNVNTRDGGANLIGGSDSGVAELLGGLTSRNSDAPDEDKNGGILAGIPILGSLLSKRDVQDLESRNNVLGNLPILGPILAGGAKKEKKQNGKGTQPQKKTYARDEGLSDIAGKLPIIGSILHPERRDEHQHEERQIEELMSKAGLGALFGSAQHGVGLLPQRRDEEQKHENEARDSPLQGATLVDAVFKDGVLGRIKGLLPGV
ncbi:hypothetical protein N7510_009686 [Penicillium lagena]|uniref:uncharacterized protein n=1 Tax=Penicillium lagena TaxID=94218 RepID=UPI00253FE009|nr:uncharacterized protein N7510_009686 [Penicillium lagena]KAJ5604532.1 hypothetical protein N7510_009686 [Penicillium lagena]